MAKIKKNAVAAPAPLTIEETPNVVFLRPSEMTDWRNTRIQDATEKDVESLADDIQKRGQIYPLIVRKAANGIEVIAGRRRRRAGLIVEKTNPDFRLAVTFAPDGMTDEEATLLSIRENQQRKNTTPIDDAANMKRLIDEYKYDVKRVADLYSYTTAWVGIHLRALTLPAALRKRIIEGKVTISDAVKVAAIGEEKAAEAIDEASAKAVDGIATQAEIRAAAREKGLKIGRTASDMRKLIIGREDAISRTILDYLSGKTDGPTLLKALDDAEAPTIQAAPLAPETSPDVNGEALPLAPDVNGEALPETDQAPKKAPPKKAPKDKAPKGGPVKTLRKS